MAMLEFRAIYLHDCARIAEERLRHCFHHSSLARAGRPKKQKIPHRPAGSIQAGEEHLVDLRYLFDCRILPNNFSPQSQFEVLGVCTAKGRIKSCIKTGFHKSLAVSLWPTPAHLLTSAALSLHEM